MERLHLPFPKKRCGRLTIFNGLALLAMACINDKQGQAGNALTEFTALDPDQISLDITLSAQLGVDPMAEIWDLWRCMRNGQTLPLTIGEHAYGSYRWNITSLSTSESYFDQNGNLYHAVVTLKLQEYLKG